MNAPLNQNEATGGLSDSNAGLGDWIACPTLHTVGEYPDFREHGFHTGRFVEARFDDETEARVIYQGYGMFGMDNREDVTHWRPSPNVKIEGRD